MTVTFMVMRVNHQHARTSVYMLVWFTVFAITLILRTEPVSPVFASQLNGTSEESPDLGTGIETSSVISLDDNLNTLDVGTPCGPEDAACSGSGSNQFDTPSDTGPPPPPPPCDPQAPGCDVSPCEPEDPQCPDDDEPPPDDPIFSTREICGDDIDNDGDGLTDGQEEDCGGGPLFSSFPGGAAGTPSRLIDRNTVTQPTILASLLTTEAEATAPREDICNDGVDNNENGAIDIEDAACSVPISFEVPSQNLSVDIVQKYQGNPVDEGVLTKKIGTLNSLIVADPSKNTSIILIPEGGKHDIRTVSMHYKYTPEHLAVEKGSRVKWINQDSTESHGIKLIDNISGKVIFSYPVIRYATSAYYDFERAGDFTYSDPLYPSMTGKITVTN
jgi:plastocyanin